MPWDEKAQKWVTSQWSDWTMKQITEEERKMGRLPKTPEEMAAAQRAMGTSMELRQAYEEVKQAVHEMGDTVPEGGKDTNPKDLIGSLKPGVSCVPTQVWALVGLAMAAGQKYGRHNYRAAGVRSSVYIDAAFRHLNLQYWDMGEDIDAASGLHHVVKAIAGLVVLMDSILQGNVVDDRPPKAKLTMKELQKSMDGVLGSLDKSGVLPPWTEQRINRETYDSIMEKEHVDVDYPKSNRSVSSLADNALLRPKA